MKNVMQKGKKEMKNVKTGRNERKKIEIRYGERNLRFKKEGKNLKM